MTWVGCRYKNVYHSVAAGTAVLFSLLLLIAWLLLLGDWTQRTASAVLVNGIVLVLGGAGSALSVAVIRMAPSIALQCFSGTLGVLVGVVIERIATDLTLICKGFIAAYPRWRVSSHSDLYLALALLPVVFAVGFAAIPLRWQWQFLAGIALTASGFVVEGVFLVVLENTHSTEMLGKSCNLLADALELLVFVCLAVGMYQLQRKVGPREGGER